MGLRFEVLHLLAASARWHLHLPTDTLRQFGEADFPEPSVLASRAVPGSGSPAVCRTFAALRQSSRSISSRWARRRASSSATSMRMANAAASLSARRAASAAAGHAARRRPAPRSSVRRSAAAAAHHCGTSGSACGQLAQPLTAGHSASRQARASRGRPRVVQRHAVERGVAAAPGGPGRRQVSAAPR